MLSPLGHYACGRSLPQDLAKCFSGGCHGTLCGAGDANGHRFRHSGNRAVKQTLASHKLENRYGQCDAASGFHFNEERITTVAFNGDAWFGDIRGLVKRALIEF